MDKIGNKPATACTQHKFSTSGNGHVTNHVHVFHPGMTVRQTYVMAAMVSHNRNEHPYSDQPIDDYAFDMVCIADACLKLEAETRE